MSRSLKEGIEKFPIIRWLESRTKLHDNGSMNVHIDCPVCGSSKRLGIHRTKKTGQCFKCNEGGAGGKVWSGTTGLIGLIQLIEKCDKRTAVDRIFELAGMPDTGYQHKHVTAGLPRDAIPLSSLSPLHPAREMMQRRGAHLIDHCSVCIGGPHSHRVIMPIRWFGELRGFEAKAYTQATPKSLTTLFNANGIYSTIGWDHTQDFAVITESVLDAETLKVNACGILGSVLRDGQLNSLLKLRDEGVQRLVWFLDFDAWRKQYNTIFRKTGRFDNYVVPLREDSDPNDLGYEKCWELVSKAIHVRDPLDLFNLEFSLRA